MRNFEVIALIKKKQLLGKARSCFFLVGGIGLVWNNFWNHFAV